jgi:glycosyltransferase involved in cell wall biosynthesis
VNFEHLPTPCGPAKSPSILFVGREFDRKGGDVLMAAFAEVRAVVPNAALHIVGNGAVHSAPGVEAHGRVQDRRRLRGFYEKARVFCLPSRYEPYGLVLTEAMAHGVPCVGTRVQSIPEILDHGRAGTLVSPGDPKELADALVALLTDDSLAHQLGSAGRLRVEEELNWDRVADRMAPILARARAR